MLPEEGFPVFYRYFRDRISWYEADAVCQFHHAHLVTGKWLSPLGTVITGFNTVNQYVLPLPSFRIIIFKWSVDSMILVLWSIVFSF